MATILIVDDEPAIRVLMQLVLQEEGYRVRDTGTMGDAAAYLTNESIDLMILDILMPECNGLERIPDLRRRYPKTRNMAMSGGGSFAGGSPFLDVAKRVGAHGALQKPFEVGTLLQAVKQALDETVEA
jgi:DNA-binding NtrC family response regulator